jgi:hypothetical protein
MIVPPMIRQIPFWYARWYNSLLLVFNDTFHQPHIAGVVVLPSFPDPVYDTDCVHFTEECGSRFVTSLIIISKLCLRSLPLTIR